MTDTPPAAPPGAAPRTIDLGTLADAWTGQTVTIRPHLSYAAHQRVEAARLRMTAVPAGADGGGAMTLAADPSPVAYACALVEESVIEWTLTGYDGRPLAANAAGVTSPQAPATLLDAVIDEIAAHYEATAPKLRTER